MRLKRKTKFKAGGIQLDAKLGTHSSSTFVFRDLKKPPTIGDKVHICATTKFEGTSYLGDRDWDYVKIDDVFRRDENDPTSIFVVMHFI